MRRLWQFIALREAFTVGLPWSAPAAIVTGLASRVRPWRWWYAFSPPVGEYVSGEVSADGFAITCVTCKYSGVKLAVRRVFAIGTIRGTASGTTAAVVVRHVWVIVLLNWLLLALTVGSFVGYPLLMLDGSHGPVLVAGCGGLLLGLLPLWLYTNATWWRQVQEGRGQISQVLKGCSE